MKRLLTILCLFIAVTACKQHRSDKAGKKMQDFIIAISSYARSSNPNFILIPQNGAELLFNDVNADGSLDQNFLAAINGIAVEELYFNGTYQPDDYRLQMLLKTKASIPVLVADYHQSDTTLPLSYQYADSDGFIAFPRVSNNYDYQYIPDSVHHENANDVLSLSAAQNYLYLISTGGFPDKASYLAAIQQTNFDAVIIDAFYGDELLTSAEVSSLKTKANGGQRLVIAYMSIGSAEKYRYYWKEDWKIHHPRWLKKEYDGYPDEIWVKYWKQDWKDIIYGNDESYTKKLLNVGFDGTYLDNVEAFYFLYFDE